MKRDCLLTINSPEPYVIGTTISITVDVTPYSAGLRYVWFDNTGILEDAIDASTINIYVSNTKYERIISVSVVDGDSSVIASIKYTAQHAEVVPTVPTVVSGIKRKRDNLELHKWLSYAPRWSFAYQSHLSNYSKLTSGIFDYVKNIESRPIMAAAYNYTNSQHTMDFNPFVYKKSSIKIPKEIITNMGVFENIGQNVSTSISTYPITNLYLVESKIVDFEYNFNVDESFERFIVSNPSFLYLTLSDNVETDVTIVGLDSNGKLIMDSIHLLPKISHMTTMKYKAVIGVYSNATFDISTLSKSDSYMSKYVDYKRIVDRNGDYFEPFFTVDNIDPTVLCAKKIDGRDIYKFRVEHEIDKFVVTENLDILYISNNNLYSAKPYLDVSLAVNINSTFNNNDICSTEYDDVADGEYIVFTINIEAIKNLSNAFSVKIENSNTSLYLTQSKTLVAEKSSIKADVMQDKVSIKIQKLNKNPYILSLQCDGIREIFQCGVIDNNIDSYLMMGNVNDLSVYNGHVHISCSKTEQQLIDDYQIGNPIITNELIETKTEGSNRSVFKILPIRGCYTSTEQSTIFNTKITIEEELYE